MVRDLTFTPGDGERTGWRDESISRRHRKYGPWAAAIDIDFVLIEGAGVDATPKALIEYKHFMSRLTLKNAKQPQTYQVRLLRNLCDRAGLPLFLAKYWPETWAYEVHPLNDNAYEFIASSRQMTEHQYVEFLSRVRGGGHVIPGGLNHHMPPKEIASRKAS